MSSLADWDFNTFEKINQGLANPFFDVVMPVFRNPWFWTPIYAFFGSFFVLNFKKKGLYIILFALFTFLLTDQVSGLLKTKANRPRPCADSHYQGIVRSLIPCGPGKSFPSSHATNHFGISLFLIAVAGHRMKGLTLFALFWASLVSFAQVYVGVHYPLDVLFGAITGSFIGGWLGYVCNLTVKPFEDNIIK